MKDDYANNSHYPLIHFSLKVWRIYFFNLDDLNSFSPFFFLFECRGDISSFGDQIESSGKASKHIVVASHCCPCLTGTLMITFSLKKRSRHLYNNLSLANKGTRCQQRFSMTSWRASINSSPELGVDTCQTLSNFTLFSGHSGGCACN